MRGWSELALLATLCATCWTRTPLGTLGEIGMATWRDMPTPDLFSAFRTSPRPEIRAALDRAAATAADAPSTDGSDAGDWSPALHAAIVANLGAPAFEALDDRLRRSDGHPGDVEAALEEWSIGRDLRARAIARARAAGEREPARYLRHRRYLPTEAATRADRSVRDVLALATALDLAWPVRTDTRVSSPFGWRDHPILARRAFHEGIDLALPEGTKVAAAGSGRIRDSGEDGVNGRYVVVDHGHGVTTSYCHGATHRVRAGQRVGRGDWVMDSGNTGRSTGPHLHFGVRINGRPVDPTPFSGRTARSADRDERDGDRAIADRDRGPGSGPGGITARP